MAKVRTCQYGVDGRLGSYIYLFICVEDGKFIVKLGVSDFPSERLMALRLGCPFKPKTFATMRTPTRAIAFCIERSLLQRLEKYKTRGEWMRFTPEQKRIFNLQCEDVVAHYRKDSFPMKWEQVSMERFEQAMVANKKLGRKSGHLKIKDYKSFERGLAGADRN